MQILTFEHQPIIEMDRLVGIHRVTVFKQLGSNCLFARVVLMDDLFHYQYPFLLPRSFLSYKTRYDLYLKIEILRVLSVKDRKKILHLDNFLNKFSVSNCKKK